jgi:hypothetical protein
MEPLPLLLEALVRERRANASFEDAWPRAVGDALALAKPDEMDAWSSALSATVDAWRSSWHRWPAGRTLRAIATLVDDPDREPVDLKRCPVCKKVVQQPDHGRRRTYCTYTCQRAANGRRVPVAA